MSYLTGNVRKMCVKYYCMSLQERWLSKPVVWSGFTMDQQTQKAKSVVFGLCLIRQVNTAPLTIKKLIQPTLSSIDEIHNIAGKCCTRGESERSPLNARLQGASAENLLEEGISYNKQCYKNSTNKIHNGRVKATYEKGKRAGTGLHPSLNERRQEDHLPLVYLNPRQH